MRMAEKKEHNEEHHNRRQGPEFLGSATVGERGQVVIPAGARQKLDIKAGEKLLFFTGFRGGHTLMMIRSEQVTEFVSGAIARLSRLEELARAEDK